MIRDKQKHTQRMSSYTVASWNVNGLRAALRKKTLQGYITESSPTILCLQEIKCDDAVARECLSTFKDTHPFAYFNTSKSKKGYSGTAVLSKVEPSSVLYDLPNHKDNDEGRVITARFDELGCTLVTVYTPNSGQQLERLEYRTGTWDTAFADHIHGLQKRQKMHGVVLCGDLNVARTSLDIYNPKLTKSAGFTEVERERFESILARSKLIDTFRHLHPTTLKYSFWSNFGKTKDPQNADALLTPRQANRGWRIDYVLVTL